MERFEYVCHQILRKGPEWGARDLFRQRCRQNAGTLVERPLDEGGLPTNADTVIHPGKIREGARFRRAMYLAKYRGGACPAALIPSCIDPSGLRREG